MIIEISTAEFLSFVGLNFQEHGYITYRDLFEKANQIEHRVKGIRIDLSELRFRRTINIYGIGMTDNRVETQSPGFRKMLSYERIPNHIASKLIQILRQS